MTQRCNDCDGLIMLRDIGNGKCSHCHGSGKKNTIANDISGVDTKCWKCKGTGRCSVCAGSGEVTAAAAAAPKIKTAPIVTAAPPATDIERSWYRLCDGNDFLDQPTLDQYTSQLKAMKCYAAIAVGLHHFAGDTCPACGAVGHFKIHFLGGLKHPGCGANWHMAPGGYIGFQVGQIFHSGISAGGSMKDDADRKGDRTQGIVNAIVGFLFGAVFRGALAMILIPIQAVVSLASAKPSGTKPAGRKA